MSSRIRGMMSKDTHSMPLVGWFGSQWTHKIRRSVCVHVQGKNIAPSEFFYRGIWDRGSKFMLALVLRFFAR